MIPISDAPGQRRRFPLVNVLLIAATTIAFLYFEVGQSDRALSTLFRSAGVVPGELVSGRDVPPLAPLGSIYATLLSSMFLHGGWLHLGSNMLYLWVFGDNVEDSLGSIPYLLFYGLCGILAGLTHVAFNLGSPVPSIGASGAIAGVLGAYLVLFPHAKVRTLLFLGPFITVTRVSAILLIGFWFVLQLLNGLTSLGGDAEQSSGVAVWAHVGGFVAGFILVRAFRLGSSSYAPAK